VKPSTITAGERATLSFYILRPRKVRFTPETPELTKWNTDSDSLEYLRGSAVVQPKETTTYSVVATIDRSGTLKEDDRQVTLVVQGDSNTGRPQPCSPFSIAIDTLNTRSGSMSVTIAHACSIDSARQDGQWAIIVDYKAIKGTFQRTTYVANNAYEVRELQDMASTRKLSKSLVNVLDNEVAPIFASGSDPNTVQAKVADALRRALAPSGR